MNVKVWGARGSIPAPGPETMRYGGNTSCVELTLARGGKLILDAGTGIRNLGLALRSTEGPIHVLLTHLHLDHIQGLMFFAPAFHPDAEIVIWDRPRPRPRSATGSPDTSPPRLRPSRSESSPSPSGRPSRWSGRSDRRASEPSW